MSGIRCVNLGSPALLQFRGPDAARFLNGQLTQDVRWVAGGKRSLPSCVTDAKGKLQFRVSVTEADDGALWVEGPADATSGVEARLTRYLIADDVEVVDLTGSFTLLHLIGVPEEPPAGVMARISNRYGVDGVDWWVPCGLEFELPDGTSWLAGEELEAIRIASGIPVWGRELTEGMLPPEAGLDVSDVSYQKGCYIGQEIISRMKSSGKVNRRLARLSLEPDFPIDGASIVDSSGGSAGQLTSISPRIIAGYRPAMAYIKRGVDVLFITDAEGGKSEVSFSFCPLQPVGIPGSSSPTP